MLQSIAIVMVRRYHTFEEDAYWLPNDDAEIKRLGIQHHAWRLTLNGKLYTPIPNDVQYVVDANSGALCEKRALSYCLSNWLTFRRDFDRITVQVKQRNELK
jgi:hypothetical protein